VSFLADLVPALQRAVAVPGTFEALFPDTLDDDLVALLGDAMAEAQFDGWLAPNTLDDLTYEATPDLTRAEGALLVLYASIRMLTAEIRNRKTHTRYEAGGAVYEQDQSAQMMVELLRGLAARKAEMLQQAGRVGVGTAIYMVDAYPLRALSG
jgi:hypothetical protein